MPPERIIRRAIVKPPAESFARGLTTAALGKPDPARALAQHGEYCRALERCGVEVEALPGDEAFPDSTFVEDTAVLARGCAVLTRPGAASRAGEVEAAALALARWFPRLERILAPGTLDGGDVCETAGCVFIGMSERTNEEGAAQLARLLASAGHPTRRLDIRGGGNLLHLKTGLSDLGRGRLLVAPDLLGRTELDGFEIVAVDPEEAYAANAVCLGDRVLLPAGFPRIARRLEDLGCEILPVPMSEFQKMDGGPSCLSLRF